MSIDKRKISKKYRDSQKLFRDRGAILGAINFIRNFIIYKKFIEFKLGYNQLKFWKLFNK